MRECRDSTGADVLFGPRVMVVDDYVSIKSSTWSSGSSISLSGLIGMNRDV